MLAADGKMRLIDAAPTEDMLRLIQSIPSPKAEPFRITKTRTGTTTRQYKNLKNIMLRLD